MFERIGCRVTKWLAIALLAGALAPAWASEGSFSDGVTALEISAALADSGLTPITHPGPPGPDIWSRLDKQPFNVFFFGCSSERTPRCREVQFYAGFPIDGIFPTAEINSWNGSHRFGRAYIDDDGDAALEMDLDAIGTSKRQIKDAVLWWKTLVPQFAAFLEQSMKPRPGPSASRVAPPAPSAH